MATGEEDGYDDVRGIPSAEFGRMRVPSNWHLNGLPDFSGTVWFRTALPSPEGAGRDWLLTFPGVDYFADVYFNRHFLGLHEGYFAPFYFDVGGLFGRRKKHALYVRVSAPSEGADWPNRKRQIKGVLGHFDARPGNFRPRHDSAGNTGGIWAAPYLLNTDGVYPENFWVDCLRLDARRWALTFNLKWCNLRRHRALGVRVEAEDLLVISDGLDGGAGRQHVKWVRIVDDPRLWWTWDLGEQAFYRARITFNVDGRSVGPFGERFGVREAAFGADGRFHLNGRELFLRGTCFVPAQWLSEYSPDKIETDARLVRSANLNCVRMYAHVNRSETYERFDREGILVWQDFPLWWTYAEDRRTLSSVVRQAREMVELVRRHPSVIAYSGHVEPGGNRDRIGRIVAQELRSHDATRGVFATIECPDSAHAVFHRHHHDPDASGRGGPYVFEFGAQALPSLATLKTILTPEEIRKPAWRRLYTLGYDPQLPKDDNLQMGRDIGEFVVEMQRRQYERIKAACEKLRLARGRGVAGIFHFMFVDGAPAISHSVVDYYRRKKTGYAALAQGMNPILLVFEGVGHGLVVGAPNRKPWSRLWVVNDGPHPLSGVEILVMLEAPRLHDVLIEETYTIEAAPASVTLVHELTCDDDLWNVPDDIHGGLYVLRALMKNSGGEILSENETAIDIVPGF